MKFVTVATFLTPQDARRARAFLDSHGIEAILLDGHTEEMKLLVRTSLVPRAQALLHRPAEKPSCPKCGSTSIHAASSSAFLPKRWRCDCGHHWRKWFR